VPAEAAAHSCMVRAKAQHTELARKWRDDNRGTEHLQPSNASPDPAEPPSTDQSPADNKPPYSNLFSDNLDKQKSLRLDNNRLTSSPKGRCEWCFCGCWCKGAVRILAHKPAASDAPVPLA